VKAAIFGDSAVTEHLVDEHEDFHGQQLHALYRSTSTWLKEAGDWKLVAKNADHCSAAGSACVAPPQNFTNQYVGRYRAVPTMSTRSRQRTAALRRHERRQAVGSRPNSPDVLFTPGQRARARSSRAMQ